MFCQYEKHTPIRRTTLCSMYVKCSASSSGSRWSKSSDTFLLPRQALLGRVTRRIHSYDGLCAQYVTLLTLVAGMHVNDISFQGFLYPHVTNPILTQQKYPVRLRVVLHPGSVPLPRTPSWGKQAGGRGWRPQGIPESKICNQYDTTLSRLVIVGKLSNEDDVNNYWSDNSNEANRCWITAMQWLNLRLSS